MRQVASPINVRHFAAEHLTWLSFCGFIAVVSGFTPDEWVARLAERLRLSGVLRERWPTYIDIRTVLVGVGVAIIVADVLSRRHLLMRAISGQASSKLHVNLPQGQVRETEVPLPVERRPDSSPIRIATFEGVRRYDRKVRSVILEASREELDDAYRQQLFQIVNDPRFPGVEQWKELLAPTSTFKTALVNRRLVGMVNKLYGWHLADDGQWTAEQANDVMFDIVATPGFSVDGALRNIAAGRKP